MRMEQAKLLRLKQLELEKIRIEKQELMNQNDLPHLYGWPWYAWARKYFESENDVNLLCAANQISKSSTMIRKAIDWATDVKKWNRLWGVRPRQFWYLYPTLDVATIEFEKKWLTEFMPRGEMKHSEEYGWKTVYQRGLVKAIHFNSGVTIYFKAYSQDVHRLQSGTVHGIFCDEELPEHLYDELQMRVAAVGGHFHMVFTATLNQDFWRRAIEPASRDTEFLPDAFKLQVSMRECLVYEDGSPSTWTEEKIQGIEAKCKSEVERQRRVDGRFVTEKGRLFGGFNAAKHYIKDFVLPRSWSVYGGVDIGSGGKNHPPAIVFIAVRPDHRYGVIFKTWRGDDGTIFTNGDIYNQFVLLSLGMNITLKGYDFAAKDFGTITGRVGDTFMKSDKSHELGEGIINTLFKNDMLVILDNEDNRKLGSEYSSLLSTTPKNKRKDDLADASRYGIVLIPWDFEAIVSEEQAEEVEAKPRPMTAIELAEQEIMERRGMFEEPKTDGTSDWAALESEIEEWNELYG